MGGNDYFCSRNFKQANNKINMNSVLEGRPALKKEVEKIAEVADTSGRMVGLSAMVVTSL